MKQIDPQNPRFATLKSQVLANGAAPCLIGEKKGDRLSIESLTPIAPCTAATVEFDDALFLGEVIKVHEVAGTFTVEIKVEQVLSGLQSLLALRTRLLGDALTVAPAIDRTPALV